MANCPECEALLDVDDDEVEEGDIVNCQECGLELEIVTTNPIEVERIEEEDEEGDEDEEGPDKDDEDDAGDEEDDEKER